MIFVSLILRLIGLVDVELKGLDYGFVMCLLGWKCYKNVDDLPMGLIMNYYVNVLTSNVWIVMKTKILMQFLLRYNDDDDDIMVDHMT